jgi:predicted RND superfamily exporter protein
MQNRRTTPSHFRRFVDLCADFLISNRKILFVIFALMTLGFGYSATKTRFDPGFLKMIPMTHPYMQTFEKYMFTFPGANQLLLNVRWKGEGDIYNKEFLDTLRKVTDAVFFTSGVQRSKLASLFTPNVKYVEVTEEGFRGDVVVPAQFSSDNPADLEQVRVNVTRSGEIGRLVSTDLRSAMVAAELQEKDPNNPGEHLNLYEVSKQMEEIRRKYESPNIEIGVMGFTMLVGDVISGFLGVLIFFGVAFVITAVLLFLYCRSLKLTVVALGVALLPVIWLLGLLPLMGLGIDPISLLVPFLIFSIGVSHAVQMTNAWKLEMLKGAAPERAAHAAIRKLFIPGTIALLTNALGFLVIMQIEIPIVHELGITACLGVLLMIITNKMMLPIILSHLSLEQRAMKASTLDGVGKHPLWWRLSVFTQPKPALVIFAIAAVLLVVGTIESRKLQIGDIGIGFPELRESSRLNKDTKQIAESYQIGTDVLTVIAEARNVKEGCLDYPVMNILERFEFHMRGVDGVQSVISAPTIGKIVVAAQNEGNPRWATIGRSYEALRQGGRAYDPEYGINTEACQAIQTMIFLRDHKGTTLAHAVKEIKDWTAKPENQHANVILRLAGGNAGVMAATNEAVEEAEITMLLAIFGAITLLCLITFRSWRAALCIIVPLTLVSILCNALMPALGIGLKVATLPVIALGVGVGVDYGIYLFERIQHQMEHLGHDLRTAFYEAMCQRGTAAVFTAITMSIGVGTWSLSALKYQADMGLLLAFMFLVNVLGAIFFLPALAAWLNMPSGTKDSTDLDSPPIEAQGD